MTGKACRGTDGDRQVETCRALVREREMVMAVIPRPLCANAYWDMLLALYLAGCERRRMMVTALCAASHVPEATAYRKIADLERHGLVARGDDAEDRRRVEITLTNEGSALLTRLLARLDCLFAGQRR